MLSGKKIGGVRTQICWREREAKRDKNSRSPLMFPLMKSGLGVSSRVTNHLWLCLWSSCPAKTRKTKEKRERKRQMTLSRRHRTDNKFPPWFLVNLRDFDWPPVSVSLDWKEKVVVEVCFGLDDDDSLFLVWIVIFRWLVDLTVLPWKTRRMTRKGQTQLRQNSRDERLNNSVRSNQSDQLMKLLLISSPRESICSPIVWRSKLLRTVPRGESRKLDWDWQLRRRTSLFEVLSRRRTIESCLPSLIIYSSLLFSQKINLCVCLSLSFSLLLKRRRCHLVYQQLSSWLTMSTLLVDHHFVVDLMASNLIPPNTWENLRVKAG